MFSQYLGSFFLNVFGFVDEITVGMICNMIQLFRPQAVFIKLIDIGGKILWCHLMSLFYQGDLFSDFFWLAWQTNREREQLLKIFHLLN